MDNLQLSELAQRAKDGDMAAFEKLYIELSPDIYAIACEITKNKEESRDLMQDCFVAAMENISTLNEPEKIKNWLIRIAANKSRDYIKKKKPSALTEDQYEIIDNIEDEDISVIPEASLETEERIEDVNEILACLTEEKRLCLLLRFRYDMSYAEIANELGITESAVKSRISRAKDDIEKEAEKRKKKGVPLFGVAPFGLVIFALKKSADITAASFAGSAAQTAAFAGVTAASQVGIAASTAATATTAASATASAAGTTATAATGIGAKVAAMSVAQKVVAGITAASIVTGSAVGTTVVVKNKIEAKEPTTTAYIEEVTTAPDYGFEDETVFVPAVAETESSTSELSTSRNSTYTAKQSTTVTQAKETEKSTVANKTTTKSTTKANTTTQKQTATTAKAQTTTKAATTKKETATEKATTAKPTTTKAVTTAKATTTTTTKATTTAAVTTTESASPATVTVTVWGETSSTTKTLYFEAGETITASKIENKLSDEYGIEAIADDINITAEAGGNYTATAYE